MAPTARCSRWERVTSPRNLDGEMQSEHLRTEPSAATLLRIYLGKVAHYRHHPTYEAIVQKAREMHLPGATVVLGAVGFGKSGQLHAANPLHLADDVPVIVQIVGDTDRIHAFLPVLEEMMTSGIATLNDVQVHAKPDRTVRTS